MSEEIETIKETRDSKLVQLPLSRIRRIMKLDPDALNAASETVFLIAKATELLLESLAKEAQEVAAAESKKTVTRKHLDTAIENIDALTFLEGTLD